VHGRIGLRVAHGVASTVDNRRTRGGRPPLENRVCDGGGTIQYRHLLLARFDRSFLNAGRQMLKSYRAHIEVIDRRDFQQWREIPVKPTMIA
jgi:hypothetical protein